MSAVHAVQNWWDKWKITILFVGLVFVSLSVYRVNDIQNDRRVAAACESVTQVKDAALSFFGKPTPIGAETDPLAIARIERSNALKADAAKRLNRKLTCK